MRIFAVLIFAGICAPAAAQQGTPSGYGLKIMTRNLYQGTDFEEVMGATDLPTFMQGVTRLMQNVRRTNPADRMAAIAREITDQRPDLLAVQEATIWTMNGQAEFDLLQLLLNDLDRLGTPYVPAKVVKQFEFGPVFSSEDQLVSTATRIAILVRANAAADGIVVSHPDGGLFQSSMPVPVMGVNVPILRGWASVDVSANGHALRFITAHPEAFQWYFNFMQVDELLRSRALETSLPLIMAADFNIRADQPTDYTYLSYQAILTYGFTDLWAAASPNDAGFTCCQSNDLKNSKSQLDHRLDLIFTRGPLVILAPEVTGSTPSARVDGLWPSDHAGLVGRIRVQ